uniref:Uncharacterized protein n=1 Tax=Rhizophora mucronata TaxID=61149 RepID=A0A2P2QZG5_RHIMU
MFLLINYVYSQRIIHEKTGYISFFKKHKTMQKQTMCINTS